MLAKKGPLPLPALLVVVPIALFHSIYSCLLSCQSLSIDRISDEVVLFVRMSIIQYYPSLLSDAGKMVKLASAGSCCRSGSVTMENKIKAARMTPDTSLTLLSLVLMSLPSISSGVGVEIQMSSMSPRHLAA